MGNPREDFLKSLRFLRHAITPTHHATIALLYPHLHPTLAHTLMKRAYIQPRCVLESTTVREERNDPRSYHRNASRSTVGKYHQLACPRTKGYLSVIEQGQHLARSQVRRTTRHNHFQQLLPLSPDRLVDREWLPLPGLLSLPRGLTDPQVRFRLPRVQGGAVHEDAGEDHPDHAYQILERRSRACVGGVLALDVSKGMTEERERVVAHHAHAVHDEHDRERPDRGCQLVSGPVLVWI